MSISRSVTAVTTSVLVVALAGCGDDDRAIVGQSDTADVGEVVLTSDDSTDSVEPLCVGDIPEDLTACAGAPANLGQVELDQTLKATLVVPLEVATSGYRVRLNDEPLPQLGDVIEERNQVLQFPSGVFSGADEIVLTVESLRSPEHPGAVWQFLLDEPGEQAQ